MASLARQTEDDALRIEEDSRLVVQQSGHLLPLPTPSASQRRIDGDDESQDVDGVVSQEWVIHRLSICNFGLGRRESRVLNLSTDAPEVSAESAWTSAPGLYLVDREMNICPHNVHIE
jgi:hypothetical protein